MFFNRKSRKKNKKARILAETDRIEEAYKTVEELLYANYTISSAAMHGIYMLALKGNNMEKAHSIVEKQIELAKCFEMGKYYETSNILELATIERDTETVIGTMNEMLANVEDICSFSNSKLYEHMEFKGVKKEFVAELKANLKTCFQDDIAYGFLKDDERWQGIVE